jgi:hypothetical protein
MSERGVPSLAEAIGYYEMGVRALITAPVDRQGAIAYLTAAQTALQLRADSSLLTPHEVRGEVSGAG